MSQQISIPLPPYIASGQIMSADAQGTPIAITRLAGEWHAFDDFCTHAGCSFSGSGVIENGVLVCCCHGAEFSLQTGESLRGIAYEPIVIYAIVATERSLEVTLP